MDKQTIQILVILGFLLISAIAEVLKRKGQPAARGRPERRPNPLEPEELEDLEEPSPPFGEFAGFPNPDGSPESGPVPVPVSGPAEAEEIPDQVRLLTEGLERLRRSSRPPGRPESLAATLARTRKESAQHAARRPGAALPVGRDQLRQAVILSEILGPPAAMGGDRAIRNAGNERVP